MPVVPMPRVVLTVGVVALLGSFALPASAITIDLVPVGNPGNANDTTGYGAVAYDYQIGKYDVTIGQYTAFLNAVAATDTYSLYNSSMGANRNIMGIQQNGSSGNYTYSVIGSANRPITYVSWFDAARFANWMTNGQGSGSTETGAYTLNGATSGDAVAANPGAAFRLPTENEWYKAAYYSPNYVSPDDETNLGGPGVPGVPGYYAYATQSDTAPGSIIGSTANQANWIAGLGYSVTQSSSYSSSQNYLTDVGAFSGSGSFYGTFDQSGNVYQWNDLDGLPGSYRRLRGGGWDDNNPFYLSSSSSVSSGPSNEIGGIGFRLAAPVAVPEPSTYAMALAGLTCGGYSMFRRRRARRLPYGPKAGPEAGPTSAHQKPSLSGSTWLAWVICNFPNCRRSNTSSQMHRAIPSTPTTNCSSLVIRHLSTVHWSCMRYDGEHVRAP
jgi:formylglycine-generating enzyme